MTKQDNHLGVMRAIRLWHVRRDGLYIGMTFHGFVDMDFVGIFLLPRSVNKLDLYQVADILIKLAPTKSQTKNKNRTIVLHEKVNIKEIIEKPAFRYQWISENISQADSVYIARGRELDDVVELNRRWN